MPERPSPPPTTVVRRPAPSRAPPRIVLPAARTPDAPQAGGPVPRVTRTPAAPRVQFLLRPAPTGGFAIHDRHGKWLGEARRAGGPLRPAKLRFHLEGRGTSWLEVRAGDRWRRTGWIGKTKVAVHDFSADGDRLGAVCVPQGPVREGAAVLCIEDHRGEVVAEVRRRVVRLRQAFEVVCGGRPVALVTRLPNRTGEDEAEGPSYEVDCGAMDPRMVLAVVPFLPAP